jgi:soluble lytic murein transglycosylase-like protein
MAIKDYEAEIAVAARNYGLDLLLVKAVVIRESGGATHAYRFEASVAGWFKGNPHTAGLIPARYASSYGLMQILYATATDYGFSAEPEYLFVPKIGLDFGCKHLAALLKWAHGDVLKALEAYNGGKGNANGKGDDAEYARDVFARYQALKAAA